MNKVSWVAAAIIACAACLPGQAAQPAGMGTVPVPAAPLPQEALTACLLKSTTEQDRRALVQWIFLVMSRYPDLSAMLSVEDAERKRINKNAGAIFERLMVDNCGSELQLALRKSGTDAISKSFEVLGQTAMGALLQDAGVNAESASVMTEVDLGRLSRTLEGK
ncbi:MAG: hypothetical protein EOP92_19030 [Lysobacteraceae bacterium]|nr:MAG: hypothetical protein EOP92_19030 [Xanthomonadaceae bacterium]